MYEYNAKLDRVVDGDTVEGILEAANGIFKLQSHGVGKYGRCLGTIIVEDENINELLIREGLAEVYK